MMAEMAESSGYFFQKAECCPVCGSKDLYHEIFLRTLAGWGEIQRHIVEFMG